MSVRRVVAVDANVLINLIHVDALDLLGKLDDFDFVVMEDVIQEIARPAQAAALVNAISQAWIRRERLEQPEGLTLFAELGRVVDRGEAATLAWAAVASASIACDDRRARREADHRLGKGKILTTPGLLILAIRAGLLTVAGADQMKKVLEANHFKMAFASFGDVLS